MGAAFSIYNYNGTLDELESYHSNYQQEERYEYGIDTYAGHLGILPDGVDIVKRKPFATEGEAIDYIEENHQKWEMALAVPYLGKVYDYDSSSKKVRAQYRQAEKTLNDLRRQILQQIKSTKSKTIGCKGCGSSIARDCLASASCPVCAKRDSFHSTTQANRILTKEQHIQQLKKKTLDLKKKASQGTAYLVGGWCPS